MNSTRHGSNWWSQDTDEPSDPKQATCDDEAEVAVDAELMHSMKREVDNALEHISRLSVADVKGFEAVRCELCPFRCFAAHPKHFKRDLIKHTRRYHGDTDDAVKHDFVASGTKQLKLICALYDYDRIVGRPIDHTYLQRSAAIMRESVRPALQLNTNSVDSHIVLLLTEKGPLFVNKEHAVSHPTSRRIGNLYYNRDFGELALREAILNDGRMKTLRMRNASAYTVLSLTMLRVSASGRRCVLHKNTLARRNLPQTSNEHSFHIWISDCKHWALRSGQGVGCLPSFL